MEQSNEHEEHDWGTGKSSNGKSIPDTKEMLRKLHRIGVQTGRKRGLSPSANSIPNQRSMLTELNLSRTIFMDDAEASSWANVLAGNRMLESVDLSHISSISEDSWMEIFLALQTTSKLQKLSLRGNTINDDAAMCLSRVLINNRTIKVLDLSLLNHHIQLSIASWSAIFQSNCRLDSLKLARTIDNDDVMISLVKSLAMNSMLRNLDLSDNDNVTATGWNAFFAILENPTSALETLDLSFNSINDDTVSHLAVSLAENSKLRELDLNCNHNLTAAGCEHFSVALQSPHSALEKLHLRYNFMNSGTMISLAGALANNNTLKELLICDEDIRDNSALDGWAAFARVLCDKSSIGATHDSNHTLEQLVCEECNEDDLPEDITFLLRTNREHSVCQAARLKIIDTHFSGGEHNTTTDMNIQPFIGMDLKVLPHAIAWMTADCDKCSEGTWGNGFYLCYQFLSRVMVSELGVGYQKREIVD